MRGVQQSAAQISPASMEWEWTTVATTRARQLCRTGETRFAFHEPARCQTAAVSSLSLEGARRFLPRPLPPQHSPFQCVPTFRSVLHLEEILFSAPPTHPALVGGPICPQRGAGASPNPPPPSLMTFSLSFCSGVSPPSKLRRLCQHG
jgi:hypothetical protein